MTAFLRRHATLITFLLLLIILVIAWIYPSIGMILLFISIGLGLVINSLMIIKKHRDSYQQGKISCLVFVRNVFFELLGIILVMMLAGLIGNFIARQATSHMENNLVKFIVGLVIGLLVGIFIGYLVKRGWDGFRKISANRSHSVEQVNVKQSN